MAKIELSDISSGYNLSKVNENFQKIEDALNDEVLYRDNPVGEDNALQTNIDANNKRILNLPDPVSASEPIRKQEWDQTVGLAEQYRDEAEGFKDETEDLREDVIDLLDQLSPVNYRGDYNTGIFYQKYDAVFDAGEVLSSPAAWYIATQGFTSTDIASDVVAGDLVLFNIDPESMDALLGSIYDDSGRTITEVVADKVDQKDFEIEANLGRKFLKYAYRKSSYNPIYIVGDSISEGAGSTDVTTRSYASIIRSSINKHSDHRAYGFFNFNLTSPETIDGKYISNKTSSGDVTNLFIDTAFGGILSQLNEVGAYYQFDATCRSFSVVYAQDAGGGTANVYVNDELVGTIDTTSAGGVQNIAGSTTQGQFSVFFDCSKWDIHTIRIECATVGNGVRLLGAILNDKSGTFPNPTVFNVGRSSLRAVQVPDSLLIDYARSGCSIFALGVNDQANSSDLTEFERKIRVFLDQVTLPNGECVMLDLIVNENASDPYKTVIRELSEEYGYKLFDFAELWFANSTSNVNQNLLSSDGVHPSDAGHAFIARTILDYIGVPFHLDTANDDKFTGVLEVGGDWVAGSIPGYPSPYISLNRDQVVASGLAVNDSGATLTSGNVVAYIPKICNPTGKQLFSVIGQSGAKVVEVDNVAGTIELASGSSVADGEWLSLSGISYSVSTDVLG